jgi:toxin YoeB
VKVTFSETGWSDYIHWTTVGSDLHLRINALIEDARRHPFTGIGKPEALRGDLAGWWSRRITAEHRMVYRVQGRKDEDQRIEIIQCRYHY